MLRMNFDASGAGAAFDRAAAFHEARVQKAMLTATRKGGQRLKGKIRSAMAASGLGRLGNAIAETSDEKRGGIHHSSDGGVSASGLIYIRSGSERTRGAIEAYTEGAQIRAGRGRWLWIPTADVPARASDRTRLTPGKWQSSGLDTKIGPLEFVKSVNGRPLLVVKNVGVSLAGKRRSARSLTKRGLPRKGQIAREFLVAFIGIPSTARAARIDISALHREVMNELPAIFIDELRRA